jgi:hypothetical protein
MYSSALERSALATRATNTAPPRPAKRTRAASRRPSPSKETSQNGLASSITTAGTASGKKSAIEESLASQFSSLGGFDAAGAGGSVAARISAPRATAGKPHEWQAAVPAGLLAWHLWHDQE